MSNNPRGNQGPPYLPPLVKGEKIKSGPFTITVTDDMVAQRERQNEELARRWELDQRRAMEREEEEEYFGEFKKLNIRRLFVRKVFFILSLQFIYTASFTAFFVFYQPAKEFSIKYPFLWIIALIVLLFTLFSVTCYEYARRQPPFNYLNLILITISMSYLTAFTSIFYSISAVMIAMGATSLITIFIGLIATFTKFDLTKYNGLLTIVGLVALLSIIILTIAYFFVRIHLLQVFIALIGCLLITMYMFFDIQTIMGGRKIEISPDEVVYATVQIYIDVVTLYQYILLFFNNDIR